MKKYIRQHIGPDVLNEILIYHDNLYKQQLRIGYLDSKHVYSHRVIFRKVLRKLKGKFGSWQIYDHVYPPEEPEGMIHPRRWMLMHDMATSNITISRRRIKIPQK